MPLEKSSFLQAIELRTKKPRKGASAEEKKAIEKAHARYDLSQVKMEKEYTAEEEKKIDAYDAMMREFSKNKANETQIIEQFKG